jgi:hypothetical protein
VIFLEESIIFLGLEVGSWADWVGIVVTFLTIFLTIRYYNNDNKKQFKIVLYPIFTKEIEKGITTFHASPVSLEFYAVNFSKAPDLVYFFTIRTKRNFFQKNIRKVPKINVDWDFSFGNRVPDYQPVEPRNKTKIEHFEIHWFYDAALSAYYKTKNKKFMKKVFLEIVYVNVDGKEFSKPIVFTVENLLAYSNEKKR